MSNIVVEYGLAATTKMSDLRVGQFGIILEGSYKGALVWRRRHASNFQALISDGEIKAEGFMEHCDIAVRVLDEGDQVTLKF